MRKQLSDEQKNDLLLILETRFENNMQRHLGLEWLKIRSKLEKADDKLWSLNEMEVTGGEPDVIDYDVNTDSYVFCDCATESPKERRSLCYDQKALDSRKENKPKNCVETLASEMGVELLTEEQYHNLQTLGNFDNKTSSWIKTPDTLRKLGGALFCDFRFGRVFTYHNGAESYYASRGFRARLVVGN